MVILSCEVYNFLNTYYNAPMEIKEKIIHTMLKHLLIKEHENGFL